VAAELVMAVRGTGVPVVVLAVIGQRGMAKRLVVVRRQNQRSLCLSVRLTQ